MDSEIIRKIQSDKDKINNLLNLGKLNDDQLHKLNSLYEDLYFYLDHAEDVDKYVK